MIDVNEYLKSFYKGTKNPSLNAMKYFMDKYDNFEKNMKFIHIAGTNGKGSCTEIISNILQKEGFKVGKFLSPHLIRYNERISINGNFTRRGYYEIYCIIKRIYSIFSIVLSGISYCHI